MLMRQESKLKNLLLALKAWLGRYLPWCRVDLEHSLASLFFDHNGKLIASEVQSAVSVLLVQVALADKNLARSEIKTIVACLQEHLGLPHQSKEKILAIVHSTATINPANLERTWNSLGRRLDREQKQLILALAIKVALADRVLSQSEDRLIELIKSWIGADDLLLKEARELLESGAV